MDYLQFGRSGLYVSPLAFGSWRMHRTPQDRIEPLINEALDAGINLIDTARGYGEGRAEEWIGKAIRNRGGRDQVVIATKSSGPKPRQPNGFLTTRRAIVQHVEESLTRLQLDYIDLYQLHCVERFVPIDETLAAMTDLVKAGKIRYFGGSNYKGWQLVEACWASAKCGLYKFISDQSEYHLLDRRLERENFPAMQSYGLAALIYSPLAQGLLTGKFYGGPDAVPSDSINAYLRDRPDHPCFSEPVQAAMGKLIELAEQRGRTPTQLALAFVMKHPVTAVPIIGPRNSEQLRDCLGACDVVVDDELDKAFDAIVAPGEKLIGQTFNSYNHGPTARWF